jgi:hypothetical protein
MKTTLKSYSSRIFCAAVCGLAILASTSIASAATNACTPIEVVVKSNLVHVKCSASFADGTATIWYIAVPTSDAAKANRFLSLAISTLVSGRQFEFDYTAGALPTICGTDCRVANAFGIK